MVSYTFAFLSALLAALWLLYHVLGQKNGRKLPPGPRGLPIIGNLHIFGKLPHRILQELSKKYGDIMTLYLVNVPIIVVSSPRAAELFLKTHDGVFASRPTLQAAEYLSYGARGMAFTPYGPYWRNVRKFCTIELLSVAKIDAMAGMRKAELDALVVLIKKAAVGGEVVDLSDMVAELISNMTYKMLFGQSKDERFDLKGAIEEGMSLAGAFNLVDFLPRYLSFLGALDLQGLTRRLKETSMAFDKMLETIIDEHEEAAISAQQRGDMDFVHVMLMLKNKSSHTHDELSITLDRSNIKAIVLDMIAAAIDTSQNTIVWVMSELLRHPRVMKRLKEELKTIIGVDRMVEETDLPNLDYLYMVVKESLRLYPVLPLLGPHVSMEDIVVDGYYIPKNTRIIVNAWALGRDPEIWSQNAEDFIPERFIGRNIDLRGRDFHLIPFGSGRRGCPGMHLGLTFVQLVVAQLVHCFDWELPNGMSPSDLDMGETFGSSMPKENHLLVVPTYHPPSFP